MRSLLRGDGRRRLAPEVIQSSALDCGPAALASLAAGFGIRASYGRLREACQTDVDGTSIDSVEIVARQLGIDAEQVMLPADHLFVPEAHALPAIVVVRNPGGVTHFVVAWGTHGGVVQVMDPATGRRWRTRERFLADLYVHAMPVPAAAWKEWTRTGEFTATLRARLSRLGLSGDADGLLAEAFGHSCWRGMAALDAGTRLTASLVAARGVDRGAQAGRALRALLDEALSRPDAETDAIPPAYWMVRPHPPADDGEERLMLRGAVLVRARGRLDQARSTASTSSDKSESSTGSTEPASTPIDRTAPAVSAEVRAALEEEAVPPLRRLVGMLREDGALAPAAIGVALAAASAGVLVEAMALRALLDVGRELGTPAARAMAFAGIVLLSILLLWIDFGAARGLRRMGRHLEARLRTAFLLALPRLGDRYFRSRLVSDMAERGHAVHALRMLPDLGGRIVRTAADLALTTAAIAWIDPPSALPALVGLGITVCAPLAMHGFVAERDLRVRGHQGALSRFYLDALLGLVPIQAHGAQRSVRREHEMLAVDWARSVRGLFRALAGAEAAASLAGFSVAAWIVFSHVDRAGASGSLLLLAYWALSIPVLGQTLGLLARQYPTYRNVAGRMFEPLSAKVRGCESAKVEGIEAGSGDARGVAIEMRGVTVEASGTTILHDVHLSIAPGEHVAIVGPSGAGKSTLVGLLLGWHQPSAGSMEVDGREMEEASMEDLRAATAWVDPEVRLWNRTMAENLAYGAEPGALGRAGAAVDAADLREVVQRLPAGLQTPLGEGGGLVSGGEGQRVRFGRALLKRGARLAILDEPFRGLDREKRRLLLDRARRHWRGATLLCVTHDVGETLRFGRVLVIDGGTVVEDGAPAELAARAGSLYRRLLDAETDVRERLWAGARWRRLVLSRGRLEERT